MTEAIGGAGEVTPDQAATQATTQEPASQQAAQAPTQWYGDEYKDLVINKGWQENPNAALKAYSSLEKHLGAGPDSLLRIPNPEKQEEVDAFWTKIGRPESADKYILEFGDGVSDAEQAKVREMLFNGKLTNEQAKSIVASLHDNRAAEVAAYEDSLRERMTNEKNELTREWGQAFDAKNEAAKAALRAEGIGEGELDGLFEAIGFKKAMTILAKLGEKGGKFVDGNNGGDKSLRPLTPNEAQTELSRMMSDPEIAKRLTNPSAPGYAEARERRRVLMNAIGSGGN